MRLSNFAGGLVIFSMLTIIFTFIYTGALENYELTAGDIQPMKDLTTNTSRGNIIDQLNSLNLVQGVEESKVAILNIKQGGSLLDIGGGLLAAGSGVCKIIIGLLAAPYSITNVILTFYAGEVIGAIGGIVTLVTVYIVFILLAVYLKQEV